MGARPGLLPKPLTSFIGRSWELKELTELLRRHRLITLVGAGGCGKTRLAIELAAQLGDGGERAVYFADLGAVDRGDFVLPVVASAVGAQGSTPAQLQDGLVEVLGRAGSLIVLDTCEHLLTPAAELAERLLRACPDLQLIATSRQALGVEGELAWTVPSLSVPEPGRSWTPQELRPLESVQLFVERARLANAAFALTEQNADAIARICLLLDGIPLALELAAAWSRLIAPAQIVERLDARFEFLSRSRRAAVPRHRTLKAAVDWSYERLSRPEQILLRRLSVFAGSFDIDAGESVCAGEGLPERGLLDLLAGLVDKSMVQVLPGSARYRLLDTIRQYGHDRLREAEEAAWIERRHARRFLELADAAYPKLRGAERLAWLGRLEADAPNLRKALEWAQVNDIDVAVRLGYLLAPFYMVRMTTGDVREAEGWLDRALTSGSATPAVRAWALTERGWLAWRQGQVAAAETHWTAALQLHRERGDLKGVGEVLSQLGEIAGARGQWARAKSLLDEGLASSRAAGDDWMAAYTLFYLGLLAVRSGEARRAQPLLEQSLAAWRRVGDALMAAYPIAVLGLAAIELDELAVARARLDEAAEISQAHGFEWGNASALQMYAVLATAIHRPDRALLLAGAAEAAFARISSAPSPFLVPTLQAWLERARRSLPVNQVNQHIEAGRKLTAAEALAIARGLPAPAEHPGGLSARELAVTALIGQGLVTKEIAARLSISARTADTHIDHIREKLGLRSRTQIAAWAVHRGLAEATPAVREH